MKQSSPVTPHFLPLPESHSHLKGFCVFSPPCLLHNREETSARVRHQPWGDPSGCRGVKDRRCHIISFQRPCDWEADLKPQKGSLSTIHCPSLPAFPPDRMTAAGWT